MFITQKGAEDPNFTGLLDERFMVWPFVEVAIDTDVLAVEFYDKNAQPKEHTVRTFFMNLQYCGEGISSLTAKGAVVQHAAVLRVRMAGTLRNPFEITKVSAIRLAKTHGTERAVAFLTFDDGTETTLPTWARNEPISEEEIVLMTPTKPATHSTPNR